MTNFSSWFDILIITAILTVFLLFIVLIYEKYYIHTNKKTNKMKKTKQIQGKKGLVSNDLAIILFFAGACAIVLFTLAWIVLSKLL